uniref:Putative 52 kDa repressor of the inhibitor of the protein n=1 Tax=Rhipicephalus pulchellus TaxID=72859 RepID=L7LYN4_RHIPC
MPKTSSRGFLNHVKKRLRNSAFSQIPRNVGSQKFRENHNSSSPEEYYRRTCFIPYLDDQRSALTERFTGHRAILGSLQLVLPNHTAHRSFESLQPAAEFYMADMEPTNLKVIKVEWEIWKQKWQATPPGEMPKYATQALKQCNTNLFPNISTVLKILATLPVTTAAGERSISTLKRLKAYLRNSSVEERLNGLALMSLYRESVNMSDVIARFTKKARRLAF